MDKHEVKIKTAMLLIAVSAFIYSFTNNKQGSRSSAVKHELKATVKSY